MKILLAIKPEFASKIFAGSKKYEFRRSIFKNENVKIVVIYVSSPIKKVIGEFEIDKVLQSKPKNLWIRTRKHSGISKEFFDSYFAEKEKGYAIKIKSLRKYRKPKCLKADFNISSPPQSFLYLNSEQSQKLSPNKKIDSANRTRHKSLLIPAFQT